MEIKVKTTGLELYRFSLYHFLHSPVILFYALIVAALAAIRIWATDYDTAVLKAVFLIFIGYTIFHVLRMRTKAENQAADPVTGAEISFKLDVGGIHIRQGKDTNYLKWDKIKEVRKIGEMYVIYPAPRYGLIIPRRVLFRGREERFLSLLKQHLSKKQLKKLHLKKSGDEK